MKLKYFLDHPQIKRKKSFGNGTVPSSAPAQPAQPAQPTSQPSIAAQINFGGKFKK